MPRPFAVIGFSLFFTLALLSESSAETAKALLLLLVPALAASLLIRQLREQRAVPAALISCVLACLLFASWFSFAVEPVQALAGETHMIRAAPVGDAVSSFGRYYYKCNVYEVDGSEQSFKTRLSFSSPLDCDAYDEVSGKFTFYVPGADEDAASHFRAEGIYIAAYAAGEFSASQVKKADKPLAYRFYEMRCKVKEAVYDMLPNEYGALVIALLIGDKGGLPQDLRDAFRYAGISHIICVSGLHLSIWALFILKLACKLRMNIRLASLASAVMTVFFMALTGFPYSVVRAGVMTLLFLAANILFRESDSLNSLGAAVAVILLINPFAAGDVSLRLSFLSTLGIVLGFRLFAPRVAALTAKIRSKPLASIVKYALLTASSTLCAVSFTLPVTVELCGYINLMCFAANILAVFPATVCMVSSGMAVLASFIPPISGIKNIIFLPGTAAARFIAGAARRVAEIDILSFFYDEGLSRIWLGMTLILLGVSVLCAYKKRKKGAVLLTCALCAATFFLMLGASSVISSRVTNITVVDVGNGSAILISKGKKAALIGCGGDAFNASSKINYALKSRGINEVELLLIPREEATESSCAIDFLQNNYAKAVSTECLPSGGELLADKTRLLSPSFSESEVFDGVILKSVSTADSCYAVIKIGDSTALAAFYPGGEIAAGDAKADALICRASVPESVDASDFEVAVISGGAKSASVQNRLLAGGACVYATNGCGNVVLRTCGDGSFTVLREG